MIPKDFRPLYHAGTDVWESSHAPSFHRCWHVLEPCLRISGVLYPLTVRNTVAV